MKEKIKEALRQLLESPDLDSKVSFTYTNKKKDKSFIAEVAYKENDEPEISLVSYNGYNKYYVSTNLKHFLDELRNSSNSYTQPGDIILTRKYIVDPPAPGAIVTLSSDTYYYSVNGGLMSCNGDQLGTSLQAKFIKIINAKCNPNSGIMAYSQFKLL